MGVVDDVFYIAAMLQRLTTKLDSWLTRVCLDDSLTFRPLAWLYLA